MLDADRVDLLVKAQLQSIEQADCRALLERYLISPRQQIRNWDYGAEGERYPCWLVAELGTTKTGISYCEHGFGPSCPWGLVWVDDEWFGMDCCWYPRMEDAFRESMAWDGENPPGYEIP